MVMTPADIAHLPEEQLGRIIAWVPMSYGLVTPQSNSYPTCHMNQYDGATCFRSTSRQWSYGIGKLTWAISGRAPRGLSSCG